MKASCERIHFISTFGQHGKRNARTGQQEHMNKKSPPIKAATRLVT
jgi:hypothetical protein